MATRKTVLHYRNGSDASFPTAENMYHGEIALNYTEGNEKLFIKNNSGTVIPFDSEPSIKAYINSQDANMASAVGLTIFTQEGDNSYSYSPQAELISGCQSVAEAIEILAQGTEQDISNKYDKSGGTINGTVTIENGTLNLDVDDEDFDSHISFSGYIDDNVGTILRLNGNIDNDQYKPVIRNVGTPINDYDAANRKFVTDNLLIPNYHLVELDLSGRVISAASTIQYSTISANLTNPNKADYLDIIWENATSLGTFTRFYAKCMGIRDVNGGDLLFAAIVYYLGVNMLMIFSLDSNNVLSTTTSLPLETLENKKQSVVANSASTQYFPSTKAVFDEFQRKPVTIWEVPEGQSGLTSTEQDITANPTWQLTGLTMSPYKRVKIYTKAGKKDSGVGVDASNTPAVILEMSLDDRAAGKVGPTDAQGKLRGHFFGSYMGQKPNDANRMFTVTCAISYDKTSFAVLRMTTLYGTAATGNSDVNGYVWKIEGYYD